MKSKDRLFEIMTPWAAWYRVFKVLAVIQLLVSILLPFVLPDLDTGLWLLSFALLAFWLSNYALLRLTLHHNPNRHGLVGWFLGLWENLLFIIWLGVLLAIVLLIIKTINLMIGSS